MHLNAAIFATLAATGLALAADAAENQVTVKTVEVSLNADQLAELLALEGQAEQGQDAHPAAYYGKPKAKYAPPAEAPAEVPAEVPAEAPADAPAPVAPQADAVPPAAPEEEYKGEEDEQEEDYAAEAAGYYGRLRHYGFYPRSPADNSYYGDDAEGDDAGDKKDGSYAEAAGYYGHHHHHGYYARSPADEAYYGGDEDDKEASYGDDKNASYGDDKDDSYGGEAAAYYNRRRKGYYPRSPADDSYYGDESPAAPAEPEAPKAVEQKAVEQKAAAEDEGSYYGAEAAAYYKKYNVPSPKKVEVKAVEVQADENSYAGNDDVNSYEAGEEAEAAAHYRHRYRHCHHDRYGYSRCYYNKYYNSW